MARLAGRTWSGRWLRAAGGDDRRKQEATPPRTGLEAEVNTLRNQFQEMRKMLEDIRHRLDAK